MRLITSILFIAILSGIAAFFLPWWSLAVVAFLIAVLLKLSPGKAFVSGFLGIALLWGVWALYRDMPNQHILADRLAGVFGLQGHALFILVTAIVGGLVGGMASWSGSLMRRSIYRK